MSIFRRALRLATALTPVVLLACAHSPPVQFYSLYPVVEPATGAASSAAIEVGPAQFPRALARSQILTRTGGSRVQVNEYRVWSAPLEFEFLRVLGDNIASGTGSDRVAVYPGEPGFSVDYHILPQVLQFDGVPGDSVTLRVRWTITNAAGEALITGSFDQSQAVDVGSGDDYDALVRAHSDLIAALARTLVTTLNELVTASSAA